MAPGSLANMAPCVLLTFSEEKTSTCTHGGGIDLATKHCRLPLEWVSTCSHLPILAHVIDVSSAGLDLTLITDQDNTVSRSCRLRWSYWWRLRSTSLKATSRPLTMASPILAAHSASHSVRGESCPEYPDRWPTVLHQQPFKRSQVDLAKEMFSPSNIDNYCVQLHLNLTRSFAHCQQYTGNATLKSSVHKSPLPGSWGLDRSPNPHALYMCGSTEV